MGDKMKKIELKIAIPIGIYSKLENVLAFANKDISNTKSLNSFNNAFWAISAYLINECCYNNDNLEYFVNIHKSKLQSISSSTNPTITKIKSWLFQSNIFECNFNHCNSGPNCFSYGYRINPDLNNFFSKKSLESCTYKDISFNVSELFLVNEYNISNKCLNKLIKAKSSNQYLYIKRGKDSSISIDNEALITQYSDRIDMNEWEQLIANRLSNITVDMKKLYNHEGNDLKKLYWISRIMKHKDTEEVKFSHGRLYRNPYWHCLPKEYRPYCVYNKKDSLLEGFDVKNCFATLLLKLIEGNVLEVEYLKYRRIVRTGIYEDIAGFTTKYNRNDMKQPFCHWLFSNSHTKKLALNERFTIVRNYFKNEFPEIYNYLMTIPEITIEENGKKIKKSRLSVDCQWIENELVLNTLAKWTEQKYNVEVVTLHDAIWCKECDYDKIDWNEVRSQWYNIMNLI